MPVDADLQLHELFGHAEFRPGQRKAVQAALDGRDALVVMPTGSGKSLCYQLPGLLLDGLTVVVSPLVALMRDQVDALRAAGHGDVALLNSSLSAGERDEALASVRDGRCRLLFVAPERFGSRAFRSAVEGRGVALFAVDEAHCLSDWGHDFRPDFLRLADARDELGARCTMALTATATRRVASDIAQRLRLNDPVVVSTGFDRPNLTFDVVAVPRDAAKWGLLERGLARPEHRPAIVYAGTRARCDELAERLSGAGTAAASYHAGLSASERDEAQARFMDGACDVIVATTAFGMGVDKADVRSVWHWALPASLEAYYQEAGRAGRDGQQARCVLLYAKRDRGLIGHFILAAGVTSADVNALLKRLAASAGEDGSFEVDLDDLGDQGRTLLAIAERVHALELWPGRGGSAAGRLRLRAIGERRSSEVERASRQAQRLRWDALAAITSFAAEDGCRRRTILRHFGDPAPPAPLGRCCDVCDPPDDLTILPEDEAPARARRRPNGDRPAPERAEGPLADALRAFRQARSRQDAVPAYVVFSDATLAALCEARPADAAALAGVPGFGPVKVERYGPDIVRIVAEQALGQAG